MVARRACQRVLAASHTMIAAGTRNPTQRAPPYSASTPRIIKIRVDPYPFLASALMMSSLSFQRRELALAVKLSLVALKADTGYAQANQGEGE